MKIIRIGIPTIISIILVLMTVMKLYTGFLLILFWIVGFIISICTTTYIEIKLRMKEANLKLLKKDKGEK